MRVKTRIASWTGLAVAAAGLGVLALALPAGSHPGPVAAIDGPATQAADPAYRLAPFGRVALYRPAGVPRGVVLFLSGAQRWGRVEAEAARDLAREGAVVAGVSAPALMRTLEASHDRCINPNYGLVALSQNVQHRLRLNSYWRPVIVGQGVGAAIAYSALAQGPVGGYRGAVSMGFAPDVAGRKPWCAGPLFHPARLIRPAGWRFVPGGSLPAPWRVVSAVHDDAALRAFLAGAGEDSRLVVAGGAKAGTALALAVRPMLDALRPADMAAAATGLQPLPDDLPITTVTGPAGRAGDMMAVMYSGDGGWVGFDRQIAGQIARSGIPVVGMDSLSYFWSARTPAGAGADLGRIIRAYGARWRRKRVILIGYSFGADVLPHITAHLDPALRARVARLTLLGLSPSADFQFHLGSWLDLSSAAALPTVPAVARLKGLSIECVRGQLETDSACPALPDGVAHQVILPGGHHFDRDPAVIAHAALAGLSA